MHSVEKHVSISCNCVLRREGSFSYNNALKMPNLGKCVFMVWFVGTVVAAPTNYQWSVGTVKKDLEYNPLDMVPTYHR